MPVYNVERYVTRAIESVLAQTFVEFELLVVDDGSSDSSGEVCDRLAARDSRVRVFHQSNAGAPAARNLALDHARGDYVAFMDADDWMEPRMLQSMVELGDAHNLELVISGFYIDTYYGQATDDCFTQVMSVPSKIYASQEEFRQSAYELFDNNQLYSPWNKLYLRSYIEDKGLRFPSTFWDDFPFVLSMIRDVERVGVTSEPFYHFIRARKESETTRYRAEMYEKREEEHTWMLDLYEHWGVDDDRSMEVVFRRYSERLVGCIENVTCKQCDLSAREARSQVREMISTPQAKLAVQKTEPRSKMMAMMLWPIRHQFATMAYCEGKFISFVKRHSTHLFAKLKASR